MRAFLYDSDYIIENVIMVDPEDDLPNLVREDDVKGIPEIGKYFDISKMIVHYKDPPFKSWIFDENYEWKAPNPFFPQDSAVEYYYNWDSDTNNWKRFGVYDSDGNLTLY